MCINISSTISISSFDWEIKGHLFGFLRECAAHNTNNFSATVDQLAPEEILVIRRIVSGGN